MGTAKDPRIQDALRFARTGEKARAHDLLVEILNQDRNNFDAWIVMAQVSQNDQEAIICLKQALRLRPGDERAKRYLEHLLQGKKNDDDKARTSPWLWGGLGAALIVLLVVGGFFVFFKLGLQGQAEIAQLPTILPLASATPTSQPTTTPSKTPEVTSSPSTEPTASAMPTSDLKTSTPTVTTPPSTVTVQPSTAITETSPTAATETSLTSITDNSADPCSAFTFGTITRNTDGKAITVSVSHPGGATLVEIMVAWSTSTAGGLEKIQHGSASIPNTSASGPPGIFSMAEAIGTSDTLEFWFSVPLSEPLTGYTILLTFSGGCTKALQ